MVVGGIGPPLAASCHGKRATTQYQVDSLQMGTSADASSGLSLPIDFESVIEQPREYAVAKRTKLP